jgi:hypothetical protein
MKRGCSDEDGKGPPKRPNNGKDRAKPLSRSPSPPIEEEEEPDEYGAGSVRMAIRAGQRERDVGDLRNKLLQAFIIVSARMAMMAAGDARDKVIAFDSRGRFRSHVTKTRQFYGNTWEAIRNAFRVWLEIRQVELREIAIAASMARLSDMNERIARGFDFEVSFEPDVNDVYVQGDVDVSNHPPRTDLQTTQDHQIMSSLEMDEEDKDRDPVVDNQVRRFPVRRQIRSSMDFHREKTFVLCLREKQPCYKPEPPNFPSDVDPNCPDMPEPDSAEGYFPGYPGGYTPEKSD